MADLLVRGLAEDDLARLDAHARRQGVSRNEYVRRRLSADAHAGQAPVSAEDLARLAAAFSDAGDERVLAAAWR